MGGRKGKSAGKDGNAASGSSPADERAKKRRLNMFFLVLIAAGAVPVALKMWDGLQDFMTGAVEAVDTADTAAMKHVFFSGDPHLLFCKGATFHLDRDHKAIDRLFVSVQALAAKLKPRDTFAVASIDCDAHLPSGKSVRDRFALGHAFRLAFIVANGVAARPVPAGLLSKPDGRDAARQLALHTTRAVRVRPVTITTSMQLRSMCLRKRLCALVAHHGPLANATADKLQDVQMRNRKVRFAYLDSEKYSFSLEKAFPQVEGRTNIVFFARPVNGTGTTGKTDKKEKKPLTLAKVYKEDTFSAPMASAFLGRMQDSYASLVRGDKLATKLADLKAWPTVLSRAEVERRRKAAERKREEKAKREERVKQAQEEDEKAAQRERRGNAQEEKQKKIDRFRREQMRRAEMEQETKEKMPEHIVEDQVAEAVADGDGIGAAAAADDDEEVVDLDKDL